MARPNEESFGTLLRRLRDQAGLTQEELAAAATLSSRSISDLERGTTLTARKDTARLLADGLGLAGPARAEFEAAARGRPLGDESLAGRPGTRMLPRDIASFTGREAELRRLMGAAAGPDGPGGVHTIGGMPGVGKTALAVHAAHLLQDRFPDRQLFVDLHAHTPGREPISSEAALAALLTAIGVDARYLPESLEGRAGLWRDRMAGQRALLVLDNAAGTDQVAPLLPGTEFCLVLVTSRRHLGDLPGMVVPMLLEAMPPGQAQEMFLRLAPRVGEQAAALELARLAGNLPLAISLLARVYARHPSWTLADLTLETEARLLTLAAEKDTVAAAFEVSYRSLSPDRQQFFCRLSLHLGPTIDAYAAAALAGVSLREAGSHLDALHGECLLTEPSCRRYSMHDLIRRYGQDRAAADRSADRQQCLHRLLDYYQHVGGIASGYLACKTRAGTALPASASAPIAVPDIAKNAQALAWMRAEFTSLVACLDHVTRAGDYRRVAALTTTIAALARVDGVWTDATARHTAAVQATRHLSDRQGEAAALNDLGDAFFMRGDFLAAAEAQEAAVSIYRELGDRQGQANALSDLGGLRELMGDRGGAADLEEALAICRDLGNRLSEAWVLNWTGYARWRAGDIGNATRPLAVARSIYRDLGHRHGQACAITQIGAVRRLTGDFPGAVEALEEALDICRDLDHRQGKAEALIELGVVHLHSGNYRDAAEALEEALDICRDLDHRHGQVYALTEIGILRRETGDCQGAAKALEEALSICRELGYPGAEAEALNQMGTLHRIRGDVDQARTCHRQALELARETSSSSNEAHALAGLGRCALAAGHSADAARTLRQALEILRLIGSAEATAVAAELTALQGAERPSSGVSVILL
jgi:tetratricopeptide (TPR) repeat protein/transcriptional regulator with XRE-family HTH domain